MENLEPKLVEDGSVEKTFSRGDWERSEWFQLWLELIRPGSTQGGAH